MNWKLLGKALSVGFISLVLLIPLALVEGVVRERNARKIAVENEVAESSAGSQQLVGPLLVLTYQERVEKVSAPASDGTVGRSTEIQVRQKVVVPTSLDLQGTVKVEPRHRGLYKTQVYRLEARLKGSFQLPAEQRYPTGPNFVAAGPAFLVVGVSDRRGLLSQPRIRWQGKDRDFVAGGGQTLLDSAIEVPLGSLEPGRVLDLPFEMDLDLLGSRQLSVAPVAGLTRVALQGSWPSPSFQGRFLPLEREVGPQGFRAQWQIHQLARDLNAVLSRKGDEACAVAFLEPLNIYLQTERAVKYGVLFVLLTLGGFFLFEVLRRLPIHPVQYGLVGLALALFFLLLLSLSERLPFAVAYGIATAACVALIGTYLAGALRSGRRAAAFSLALTGLYAALFGILASEDNALLLGSLLLFALLGAVMVGTRHVDWYSFSTAGRSDPPGPEE